MNWQQLHPEVYKFVPEYWLDPQLRRLLEGPIPWILEQENMAYCLKQCLKGNIPKDAPEYTEKVREMFFMPLPGVIKFRCLSHDLCNKLVEEVKHLERNGVHLERPNSMNKNGAILTDLGFSEALQNMTDYILDPLTSLFLPHNDTASHRHVHGFAVKYKLGEDVKLSEHVDDSDTTLNVSLGLEFTGGSLFFKGWERSTLFKPQKTLDNCMKASEVSHHKGYAVMHVGAHSPGTSGHVHGANELKSGERWNLILWRNPSFTAPVAT